MQLKSLKVRNFRGVRSAQLDFSETTVLIGENNCGKTSLLDALSLALARSDDQPPQFQRRHFYWPGNGDDNGHDPPRPGIHLELVFTEKRAGEWRRPEMKAFDTLAKGDPTRPRSLSLWLEADSPHASIQEVQARWRIGPSEDPSAGVIDDFELLKELRRFNPLIELRGCPLTAAAFGNGHANGLPNGGSEPPAIADVETRRLHHRVARHFRELVSGGTRERETEIAAGFEAAEALLEHLGIRLKPAGGLTQAAISDLLGESSRIIHEQRKNLPTSSVQRMGVLIFTAVILRQLPHDADQLAWPIVMLEDPEAHLHRMTLASVWRLVASFAAQKIITTQSPSLLASAPLTSLRRLVRHHGDVLQWRVHEDALESDELRKLGYHLRARRGEASFARAWILVEGETEFWVVNELARIAGHDFDIEGIACVEFAQCGLTPLIRMARELGIEWHLLTDGDPAGRSYVMRTRKLFIEGDTDEERITRLPEYDLEHCFHDHGYAEVFQRLAGKAGDPGPHVSPTQLIQLATRRHAKPDIALQLMMEAAERGRKGVPPALARMIETVIQLARTAPERMAARRRPEQSRKDSQS